MNDLEENIWIFVTVQNVIKPVFSTIEELINSTPFTASEKQVLTNLVSKDDTMIKAVWISYTETQDFEEAEETLRVILSIVPHKSESNRDNFFSEEGSIEWEGENENGESESDS